MKPDVYTKNDLVLGVAVVLRNVSTLWRRCRTRFHRRWRVVFPGVLLVAAAAAGDDSSFIGWREKLKSVAWRDTYATGVRAQPPADETGHIALMDRKDVAGRKAQFFRGVGAVGVQRFRLQHCRRHHCLDTSQHQQLYTPRDTTLTLITRLARSTADKWLWVTYRSTG